MPKDIEQDLKAIHDTLNTLSSHLEKFDAELDSALVAGLLHMIASGHTVEAIISACDLELEDEG